jgi:hypothetical protein
MNRWDRFHHLRVAVVIAAFTLLVTLRQRVEVSRPALVA